MFEIFWHAVGGINFRRVERDFLKILKVFSQCVLPFGCSINLNASAFCVLSPHFVVFICSYVHVCVLYDCSQYLTPGICRLLSCMLVVHFVASHWERCASLHSPVSFVLFRVC